MKIIYVITKSHLGGAAKYVSALAIEAQNRGHDVAVAGGGQGGLIEQLTDAGIRVINLPHLGRNINVLADIKTFFDLVKIFKRERPEIVHLNSPKAGGLGALAARLTGVKKIIFTGHGWAFNEKRPLWQKPIIYFFQWLMIMLAHRTIAVSQKTAHDLDPLPFIKKKITVIYNGLSPLPFLSQKEARAKLSPEVADGIWLGGLAELHKNKGFDILLLAFKKVLEKIPGLTLIIIGEGEERENLARIIARYQLTNDVQLVGRYENAATLLPAFDLFIFPSRTEALPYTLLEAGAAGLPVIASKVGGIPEIIEGGLEGALVPPENTHFLADKIAELLSNKSLMQTYGQNLKKKVATHFSEQQMLEQTFNLYQK
ncbi:MAG: glycosyltransferase family 4 protein [Candidatus Pacebacteria bacterium]|nr:glycosyltransferase family 4 protein [Candidatus Paceibacterota bacterium]